MKIPCVSLWQPWASLMAHGLKKNETRGYAFRGKLPCALAIHAAKKWNRELANILRSEPFRRAWVANVNRDLPPPGSFVNHFVPLGCVVAVVRVTSCLPTGAFSEAGAKLVSDVTGVPTTYPRILSPQELAFGDYSPNRFAWITDAALRLDPPVPATGRQGLFWWETTPEVEAWVYEHVKSKED